MSASIVARSDPIPMSSTGSREKSRSKTFCRVPSNAGSDAVRYGSSSRTTTLGRSCGSAAARRRRAASHDETWTSRKSCAAGRFEAATSWTKSWSSAVVVRVEAVKNTYGMPARSRNSSTRRDFPTRRLPLMRRARPGRLPLFAGPGARRASSASSDVRPTKRATILLGVHQRDSHPGDPHR